MSTLANAQNEQSNTNTESENRHEFMPKQGDLGTTILLSGLIDNIQFTTPEVELGQNILFVRYYLEDDLSLRLGFGFDLNSINRETADSVGLSLISTDSSTSRFTLNISGGIEKHLKSTNRLDPYIYSQLNLTFVGKENTDIITTEEFSAGIDRINRSIKKDGGIGVGLVVGGGMNYFIAPRFSLGAEIGLFLQYSSIGGTISDNTITTLNNGNSSSDFNRSEDKVQRTTIGVQTNALINVSYFF
jgi:hypothetical protein